MIINFLRCLPWKYIRQLNGNIYLKYYETTDILSLNQLLGKYKNERNEIIIQNKLRVVIRNPILFLWGKNVEYLKRIIQV